MILVTGGAGFVGSNPIAGPEARRNRGIAVRDRLGTAGFDTSFLSVEVGIAHHARDFPARGDPCL